MGKEVEKSRMRGPIKYHPLLPCALKDQVVVTSIHVSLPMALHILHHYHI